MTDKGEPLLTDFGISHIMASSATSTTSGVGGSVRWMAVELLMVEACKHTIQTDVWAYGMVIYELLTRNLPFFEISKDILVALAIVAGRKPSRPSTLVPKPLKSLAPTPNEEWVLWAICQQCWEKAPHSRPGINWIYQVLLTSRSHLRIHSDGDSVSVFRISKSGPKL